MRQASGQEGVATHGLLTGKAAVNALENIIRAGSYLPKKDCEERFEMWQTL